MLRAAGMIPGQEAEPPRGKARWCLLIVSDVQLVPRCEISRKNVPVLVVVSSNV